MSINLWPNSCCSTSNRKLILASKFSGWCRSFLLGTLLTESEFLSLPFFTGTPTIIGIPKPGNVFTLTDIGTDDGDGDTVSSCYQLAAEGIDIVGAVSASFNITDAENGKNMTRIIIQMMEMGAPQPIQQTIFL